MAKIKICGLKRIEDIDYVNELKPDYVGFILSKGFRRSIEIEQARQLKSKLNSDIKAVGVFVNDDIDKINHTVQNGIIDLVQLHGDESPDYCERINAPLIKYISFENYGKIDDYKADYLLFDSGTGTGKAFDWSKIPKTNKPFFLAGGIDDENIKKAINEICPYCIDVSSSVETDGFKDYNKIKRIMECVR
ncbi:MAG: phosphoribosylanthranilate isomerase [Eubacterium sp.]